MSRRRKTLSHAEIDDFLSDISVTTDYTTTDNAKVTGKGGKQATLGNDENILNFDCSISSQHLSTEKKTLSISANICETIAVPVSKYQAPEDYIREYCKLCYKNNATNNKTKLSELGKMVLEKTKYKLLPSRYIHPELYPHPSSSIESKRALLLSLSPMLTDGENQRNKDVKACTNYTRCVVEKSKKRNASYEYLDIDTNDKIEYDEYERRYLLFVNRKGDFIDSNENYKDHDQQIEIASHISPTEALEIYESKEEPLLFIADDAITLEEEDTCPKDKAPKRRATLSPASARQMMLKAVDEEDFEEVDEKNDKEAAPFTIQVAEPSTTEDDIIVAQLGVELDAMFADGNCIESKPAPTLKACENVMKVITSEFTKEESVTYYPDINSENLEDNSPTLESTERQDVTEEPSVVSIEEDVMKSTEDFEAQAFTRLFVRFEQARWKYQWELCSHELKRIVNLKKR